jgi:hypothetical protein
MPAPRPVPIPLTPAFEPEPAKMPEPDDLPVGVVIPWPGANPVGGTANAPPPTLAGIANVVGQIEGKLDQIGPKKTGPSLEEIADKLKQFFGDDELEYPAGRYSLARPCERDSEGNDLPPLYAPWPAGSGVIARLEAKIDALALHVENHKLTKQPICPAPRSAPAVGQPVTVTFEEIGEV